MFPPSATCRFQIIQQTKNETKTEYKSNRYQYTSEFEQCSAIIANYKYSN